MSFLSYETKVRLYPITSRVQKYFHPITVRVRKSVAMFRKSLIRARPYDHTKSVGSKAKNLVRRVTSYRRDDFLPVEVYDENERLGRSGLSARALQAMSPATFNHLGYPTKVFSETEIHAFVDAFGAGDSGQMFRSIFDGTMTVSPDEKDLIMGICDDVADMTEQTMGKRIRPWCGPFRALKAFRVINKISEHFNVKLPVFELGHGAGYLGALLVRAGHRYICTDPVQSLYMWQNRLLNRMAGNELTELALREPSSSVTSDPGGQVIHVPWWEYARFYQSGCPYRASIMFTDSVLEEIPFQGMRYFFAVARDLLADDRPAGLVLATRDGYQHVNSRTTVNFHAHDSGFGTFIRGDVFGWVPYESRLGPYTYEHTGAIHDVEEIGQIESHPLHRLYDDEDMTYSRSVEKERIPVSEFFPLDWEEAPEGYRFLRYLGLIDDS